MRKSIIRTDARGDRRPEVAGARDWGDDVLVAETTRAFDGRTSVDNDELTGDIYVCLFNRDTTFDDTAYVWRSTDGGVTWLDHPLPYTDPRPAMSVLAGGGDDLVYGSPEPTSADSDKAH